MGKGVAPDWLPRRQRHGYCLKHSETSPTGVESAGDHPFLGPSECCVSLSVGDVRDRAALVKPMSML